MIVKDEKDVIARCLQSVLPIIDSWVIVDTGSTDGTQEVIKEMLKNVPGKLYEHPWVNFGHNRQEALNLAKTKGDYLLFMDADDKLVFEPDFILPNLESDFYVIASKQNGKENLNIRLAKSTIDWKWEGAIHECLTTKNDIKGSILEGVKYIYIHDGARAKDPNTPLKDIALLKEAIKLEPKNPRHYFYLANTYLSMSQLKEALSYFEKRSQMGEYEEEVFYSLLMIGCIQNELHFDSQVVKNSLYKAHQFAPLRAEPLYYIAGKFIEKKDYEKGYQILNLAQTLTSDRSGCLYIEQWIYDYALLFQFAECARKTDRFQEGAKACTTLLKNPNLPDQIRVDTLSCLKALQEGLLQELDSILVEPSH